MHELILFNQYAEDYSDIQMRVYAENGRELLPTRKSIIGIVSKPEIWVPILSQGEY